MNNTEANQPIARILSVAESGDKDLGPLKHLPGTWSNSQSLHGRGWNIIALPFAPSSGGINYRVLMNQYNEELRFTTVDKRVPNRGILPNGTKPSDQFVVTLDYQQSIKQIAAEDFPSSGGLAGNRDLAIHHEAGLWLHMSNKRTDNLDIARLAAVPHGDAVLALGRSTKADGPPTIPSSVSALPTGVIGDLTRPYLAPYQHFVQSPFKGVESGSFPGFLPTDTTALLIAGRPANIKRTTTLEVDTTVATGAVTNIPFIVKQANAASMKSTFWIQELNEPADDGGTPKLRLQYLQVVLLDFFPRRDGQPGLIRWPHVSINTMEKVST